MTVLAIVGSGRKAHTHQAVRDFLDRLAVLGPVESEIIRLGESSLEACRGCKLCMDRGEELCPLKGDSRSLVRKMTEADGVVLATPNYAFGVSGLMKVFLDRIAYTFHRPRMFGKAFTCIVAQGVFGGSRILGHLKMVGRAMGFDTVRGSCITTLEPMTDRLERRNSRNLERQAARFMNTLASRGTPRASLFDVAMFRLSRTRIRTMLNEEYRDFTWYRDEGWFESDFYFPVRLTLSARVVGTLVDRLAGRDRNRRFDSAA